MNIQKNYCMKTIKQMEINNPKNISKFKVIYIGWIHTHTHTFTQKVWKRKFWIKMIQSNFPTMSFFFFFIFTYPPKCEGGMHFWYMCLYCFYYYHNFVYWVYQKMYKFVGMAERNMAVIVTVVQIEKCNLSS